MEGLLWDALLVKIRTARCGLEWSESDGTLTDHSKRRIDKTVADNCCVGITARLCGVGEGASMPGGNKITRVLAG